ncbi:hypothetical protein [Paenibacillus elgii]|uniref:hypothetical protein n=1 Tax=Paenibacillus elgii TaxID=189691 RepID=UPI000248CEF2|nr:hypothetical protein [Paenibacillus elgii]
MDGYKHYVRTNAAGLVIHGFSSAFETPEQTDACIDENGGRHFMIELRNERGQFRYRYENGTLVERGQSDLDAEWNARPPAPPTKEELREKRAADLEKALANLYTKGVV